MNAMNARNAREASMLSYERLSSCRGLSVSLTRPGVLQGQRYFFPAFLAFVAFVIEHLAFDIPGIPGIAGIHGIHGRLDQWLKPNRRN